MDTNSVSSFKKRIWKYYATHKRVLPWRNINNPFQVFVSEVMLQQTQVARVLKKYPEFLAIFPDFKSLSIAPTSKLLSVWQGMGYNRRALYMRAAAYKIVNEFDGILPRSSAILQTLPGIGKATAGSLVAFAYNIPTVFIETNIRRVFLHHFFTDKTEIDDKQLMPLIADTLDQNDPRNWYYALMDYGVMLAKKFDNANKKSKHYSIQSKFEGSDRQIRGAIIRQLVKGQEYDESSLISILAKDETRVKRILDQLKKEGFVKKKNKVYSIAQ